MILHRALTFLLLTFLYFVSSPMATANPNHEDSEAALAVHGAEDAKALHDKAAALYAPSAKETQTYLEAISKGSGARLSGPAIGKTRLKLVQMERLGAQLEIYGEPAGTDFRLRFEIVNRALWLQVIEPYAAAPTSQNFVNSIRLTVKKHTPTRMKTLAKIQQLVAEQKWEAAEGELNELFDGLEAGTCFLSNQERNEIQQPFGEVRAAIDTAMRRIRSQEAAQLLGSSRTQQT
ncbi:MAG: hypothetical protein ABI614_13640, partial [Planctomycetota bacterium]